MKHVVMFSGGAGSWATAKRVAERHGTDDLVLLFADTLIEDEDLYRFVEQAADNVGAPLVRAAEGRDPWQVFFDVRFLGNTRVDPCSRVLKRELLRRWIDDQCDPFKTTIHFGIDWTEQQRLGPLRWSHAHPIGGCAGKTRADRQACRAGEVLRDAYLAHPWEVQAPLTEPPLLDKTRDVLPWMRREGIEPPRLYALGFSHNNCGGFCIKGGQAQFERLLRHFPDRYRYHERREQELREYLDADVAILRDRRGGSTRPLTLREFRERLEVQPGLFDEYDEGGCGCAVDVAA